MYARLAGADFPLLDAQLSWVQNEAGQMQAQFLATDVDHRTMYLKDIAAWKNGQRLFSGFVYESPKITPSDNGRFVVNATCADELARLTLVRAKTDAHYYNRPVPVIIADLLRRAPDWILADTLYAPNLTTTIHALDLRDKENLWSQIVEVINHSPDYFIRYGGYNTTINRHQLVLGTFGDTSQWIAQGDNLLSLSYQRSTNQAVTVVESAGDRSQTRVITLDDSVAFVGVTSHPLYATYPITGTAGNRVVQDNTPGKIGIEVAKTFSNVRPRDTATVPTATEIQQMSLSLWLRSVQFLKQSTISDRYQVKALLPSVPVVGDKAHLKTYVEESVVDALSGDIQYKPVFNVNAPLRILKASLNLRDSLQLERPNGTFDSRDAYELELSDQAYVTEIDDDIELFDRLKEQRVRATGTLPFTQRGLTPVSVTELSSSPANCSGGRLFTFPLGTIPVSSTNVFFHTSTTYTGGKLTFDIVQLPTLVLPLILCVKANGGWPPASNVTIQTTYTFYS